MSSLFLRENPFFESTRSLLNNSVVNEFNDDFLLHSLIPTSNGRLTAISHPRYFFRHHRSSPYKILERQLRKELLHSHDHDVFKLVDFSPKINVSEDDDHYYIHADLPGMTKDQVKMEISEDNRLFTLSGERKSVVKNDQPNQTLAIEKNQVKEEEEKEKEKEKEKDVKHEKKGKKGKKSTTANNTNKEKAKKAEENTTDNSSSDPLKKKFSLMECHYGKFKRSFTIPENVDLDHISAKMENGVLEVTFKKLVSDKTEKNKIRTIQIK